MEVQFCRRSVLAILAGAPLLAMSLPAFADGTIMIIAPHIHATPAGADSAAGYAVIRNTGSVDDKLLSATAEFAADAMIHRTEIKNGVATMTMVDGGLPVPAGGTLHLDPRQLHVMFTGLKAPLKKDDDVKGTLVFEKAGKIDVLWHVTGIAMEKKSDGMTMPDGTKMKM